VSRRRRGRLTLGTLFALRFLLIGNGVTLAAAGTLYLVYGARPGGLVVGGVLIAAAVILFSCLPLTRPYRPRRRRP